MNRYCLELQEGQKQSLSTLQANSARVAVNRFLESLRPPLEVHPGEQRHFKLFVANQGKATRYGRFEWSGSSFNPFWEFYRLQESQWFVRGEPIPQGWEPVSGVKPGPREAEKAAP